MFQNNYIIGNTPLIKICYEYKGKENYIYAKLEYYNLTGSIKDRAAYYMIANARKRGDIRENMIITEATSGNTGIALAALGNVYHNPVFIFMPESASQERVKLIKSFGANTILISDKDGGMETCRKKAKKMAEEQNGFFTNQFENYDNFLAHYETTAEEIINHSPEELGGFVSGVGTGATLMGIGKRLKSKNIRIKVAAIEPEMMPIISQKKVIATHKIEGIGNQFIPHLIEKDVIDEFILVNDEDSINMAKMLANKLGLGVGISSGANFIGAILLREKIDKPVITIFADDNKKYLSTLLLKDKPKESWISNKIKLKDYESFVKTIEKKQNKCYYIRNKAVY